MADTGLDLATLGEVMIRLSPRGQGRLEQADSLDVMVGGTEGNVAVGVARLGLRAAWISKLPADPFGRRVDGELRRHGVDTSRVVWVPEGRGRVGVYFFEHGAPPRQSQVIYYRAGSTVTTLEEWEVDWVFLASARVIHLTGITPALGPRPRALVLRAAREAKAAGRLLSFDLNYRARLWEPGQAREMAEALFPQVDVAFASQEDARGVFGLEGEPETVAEALRDRYRLPLVILTLGARGSVAVADGLYRPSRQFPAQVVDPLGAGDAFAAGFLTGFLAGGIQQGLDLGTALAAAKVTTPGDFALFSREEIERMLKPGGPDVQR